MARAVRGAAMLAVGYLMFGEFEKMARIKGSTEASDRRYDMEESIMRWTKQMRTIMDTVYASDVHLTAEEIFLESRKTMPNISLGTVYRNLKRLSGQGMLSVVSIGSVNTFSRPHDDNAHFECDKCHQIYCLPYASFGLNVADLSKKSGFRIKKSSLQMTGICKDCLAKNPGEDDHSHPTAPRRDR